jgi:hypothetical protein
MKLSEMNTKPTAKKLNKVVESRFGYALDFDKLTFKKAYKIASGLTESINSIKRTHGTAAVEQNATYMEMMMVRESIHRWMSENHTKYITESELAKSEAILAAKDMVDSIQDMLEKVSKMQSEQMPALLDTIRDQISSEQAEAFKGSMTPLLGELVTQLTSARESADTASRSLAGEQVAEPMGMGGAAPGAMPPGAEGGMPPAPAGEEPAPAGDEFAATDAAAGGDEALGRELR